MTVDYRTGDVLDQIRQLPAGSVDLVTTSPPFLALRDYNGQPGQWGSEPDPASFLDHLLELTAEFRRVLAPHGSIAIELGDTYSGSGGAGGDYNPGGLREKQAAFTGSAAAERKSAKYGRVQVDGLPPITNRNGKVQGGGSGWPRPKSLTGTPTLYAWSLAYGRNLARPRTQLEVVRWVERLRAGGISPESVAWLLSQTRFASAPDFAPWLVRNVIVWARNNPPVGALGDKVRPATSYITVACPSPRRWFDLDAVRVPYLHPGHPQVGKPTSYRAGLSGEGYGQGQGVGRVRTENPAGAPPLDHWHDEPDGDLLWLINTQGSSLAHYAMWPPRLVERLILSMCPAQVCRTCGEPRRRITETTQLSTGRTTNGPRGGSLHAGKEHCEQQFKTGTVASVATLGWSECPCADYRPGHVLDPFAGTGTTLAVADILGRDATGIDLDPANPALYPTRYQQCWAALRPDAGTSPVTTHGQQMALEIA